METNKKNVVHASADCFGGTRVLVVKLDKTYQCAPDAPEVYKRPDMYEKVRKYWRVSAKRVERAMYVLGVFKGVVVAVYKPKRWYPVEDAKLFSGVRYAFEGYPVNDSAFLGWDISPLVKGQSPVRYFNC